MEQLKSKPFYFVFEECSSNILIDFFQVYFHLAQI
jgi:hypothetical protein